MVQPTCEKEKCFFWQRTDGHCPNYNEVWYTPSATEGGSPVLIGDCAPRRTMILIQELSNRLVGLQQAQEQLRNETMRVEILADLMGRAAGIDLERLVEERKALSAQISLEREMEGKAIDSIPLNPPEKA